MTRSMPLHLNMRDACEVHQKALEGQLSLSYSARILQMKAPPLVKYVFHYGDGMRHTDGKTDSKSQTQFIFYASS